MWVLETSRLHENLSVSVWLDTHLFFPGRRGKVFRRRRKHVFIEPTVFDAGVCIIYGQHFQQGMDQPGDAVSPAHGQVNGLGKKKRFPFALENLVSRDRFGRVSLLILNLQAESGTYSRAPFFPSEYTTASHTPSTAVGSVSS